MVEAKPKLTLLVIGVLSYLRLLHDHPKGYQIDYAYSDFQVSPPIDPVIDLKKGLEIAPNVLLRFTSDDDRKGIKMYGEDIGNPYRISANPYVLESSMEIDEASENLGAAWEKLTKNINNAVTALRLLKSGYIEASSKLVITTKNSVRSQPSLYRDNAVLPQEHVHQGIYQLLIKELPELKTLSEKISGIDFSKTSSLRIALNRFEKSFNDICCEDQLIDYMIAFEALFVGQESHEKHSIISAKAAKLVAKTPEEKQQIKDTLEFAYKIRNFMVHGSDYEKELFAKETAIGDLTEKTESILRDAIKKEIKKTNNKPKT